MIISACRSPLHTHDTFSVSSFFFVFLFRRRDSGGAALISGDAEGEESCTNLLVPVTPGYGWHRQVYIFIPDVSGLGG